MAKTHPIAPIPFPADIDRVAFGQWLSGFVDGEGCFVLAASPTNSTKRLVPSAHFIIKLRADDTAILSQVQAFWGCGLCRFYDRPKHLSNGGNPSVIYRITKASELFEVLVPHFDKHPLFAKKRNDYLIWREGVVLLHAVHSRPRQALPGGKDGRVLGTLPRWTDEERAHFLTLMRNLQAQRRYVVTPPPS